MAGKFAVLRLTAGVMGIAVVDEHILLARTMYDPNFWRLPGGFLEPGESPQAALKRELMEELGCDSHVKELAGVYYKTYEANLNMIFAVDLDGEPVADGEELTEISWHSLSSLPKSVSPRQRQVISDYSSATPARVWTFDSA
jgi:8-oxo-dGTP diphosphatase